MARTITDIIFKHRFHSLYELENSVKILATGEPIVGKGTVNDIVRFKFKYGDGTTALKNLPYVKDLTFEEAVVATVTSVSVSAITL